MLNHVAQNIQRAREGRGWSQEELARRALGGRGNQAQISRYESGHNTPSLNTLSRLAIALSLPVADLILEVSHTPENA